MHFLQVAGLLMIQDKGTEMKKPQTTEKEQELMMENYDSVARSLRSMIALYYLTPSDFTMIDFGTYCRLTRESAQIAIEKYDAIRRGLKTCQKKQ